MKRAAAALILVGALWLALCAEREGEPEGRAGAGREIPSAESAGDRGAGARDLRSHLLRVVNWARDPALVYGSAGAEEVLLDTVPAADSALLELRLRVDSVVLRATSPYGTGRGGAVVRFRRGEPGRWEIPVGATR